MIKILLHFLIYSFPLTFIICIYVAFEVRFSAFATSIRPDPPAGYPGQKISHKLPAGFTELSEFTKLLTTWSYE